MRNGVESTIKGLSRFFTSTPFPDRDLLEWYRNNNFRFLGLTFSLAKRQRGILSDYWRIVQAMQKRGLIPLVHGQPALWMVPQRVMKALGCDHCNSLRAPRVASTSVQALLKNRDAVLHKQKKNPFYWHLLYTFPKLTSGKNQLDHLPQFREHLIATTLGAFHDSIDESPFSFVFGGTSGSKYFTLEGNRSVLSKHLSIQIADGMIRDAMHEKGFSPLQIEAMLQRVQKYYNEADAMEIGQMLVIGVPEAILDDVAYLSKPYGIPAGKPLKEVVRAVSNSQRVLGAQHQVRFILGRETMHPDSGIKVVSVMDGKAVDEFCAGANLKPPWEDPLFGKLMALEPHEPEGNSHEKFRCFLKRLDQAIGLGKNFPTITAAAESGRLLTFR